MVTRHKDKPALPSSGIAAWFLLPLAQAQPPVRVTPQQQAELFQALFWFFLLVMLLAIAVATVGRLVRASMRSTHRKSRMVDDRWYAKPLVPPVDDATTDPPNAD